LTKEKGKTVLQEPITGNSPLFHHWPSFAKRIFDLLLAGAALILLSPLFLILILMVRWQMGSPVFFRQRRPGLHQKPFTILKFRTMRDAFDGSGRELPDKERLTKLGVLLRKTSPDEIPELLNVLRGDMSVVGPRPLKLEYLPYYTTQEHLRHEVRPGITGLAQITGRNESDWDKRFAQDVWYVEHWSFWLDMKILSATAWHLLFPKGIVVAPNTTMQDLDVERAWMTAKPNSESDNERTRNHIC
jgi:sugar transferase EpsL